MPALRKVPLVFLNAFRFSGWRCGDRPVIGSQFNFFSRGVVTSCPRRFVGCAAAQGQDVNPGRHSCQHCSEVKLPKLWDSPRGEGRNLKLGKRQEEKKKLKLKRLWQFLNFSKKGSCLCNPVQSQIQPRARFHSQLHPQLQQGQTNSPSTWQRSIPGKSFSSMLGKKSGNTSGQFQWSKHSGASHLLVRFSYNSLFSFLFIDFCLACEMTNPKCVCFISVLVKLLLTRVAKRCRRMEEAVEGSAAGPCQGSSGYGPVWSLTPSFRAQVNIFWRLRDIEVSLSCSLHPSWCCPSSISQCRAGIPFSCRV